MKTIVALAPALLLLVACRKDDTGTSPVKTPTPDTTIYTGGTSNILRFRGHFQSEEISYHSGSVDTSYPASTDVTILPNGLEFSLPVFTMFRNRNPIREPLPPAAMETIRFIARRNNVPNHYNLIDPHFRFYTCYLSPAKDSFYVRNYDFDGMGDFRVEHVFSGTLSR